MKISTALPQITLKDIHGRDWTSTSALGKILILNFWSAECPLSKSIDEQLLSQLNTWEDRVTYAVVAANTNETLEQLQTAAQFRRIPQVLLDEKQALANQLGAQTTPHFFVFDGEGLLRYQGGFDDTSFRQRTATRLPLVEAVNALLAGREVEISESQPFGCTIVRFSG
jgi:thioredoxin-related protein